MISCILLTAGLSERFGSPKALAKLGSSTVIEKLLDCLIASQVFEIVVVLGAHSEEIKPYLLNHKKIISVYNKDYILGQPSSFKTGVKAASDKADGWMLLPVDFPLIKRETLDLLAGHFAQNQPDILIPTCEARRGHPPVFHARLKEDILNLDNATGLNVFEHQREAKISFFAVDDEGILTTFNTPQEFEELKKN